jgi:renalase
MGLKTEGAWRTFSELPFVVTSTKYLVLISGFTADYKSVHGWRYANNAKRENCHIFIDPDIKLAACGDWCLGGRVEGAFTSAYNLVNTMKESV